MPIVTGEELAAHLKIDVDSEDEEALDLAAFSACRQVQRWCGRMFDQTAVPAARLFKPLRNGVVYIDDIHDSTDLVVEADYGFDGTYSTVLTATSDYLLDPADGLRHGEAWPYERLVTSYSPLWANTMTVDRKCIRVTSEHWGWPTYPDDVRLATLIQGARLFKRRYSVEGVLGGFQDFGPVRITSRMDPDVEDLLGPYRWACGIG